jgi:hypothetical protein
MGKNKKEKKIAFQFDKDTIEELNEIKQSHGNDSTVLYHSVVLKAKYRFQDEYSRDEIMNYAADFLNISLDSLENNLDQEASFLYMRDGVDYEFTHPFPK